MSTQSSFGTTSKRRLCICEELGLDGAGGVRRVGADRFNEDAEYGPDEGTGGGPESGAVEVLAAEQTVISMD